MADVVLYDRPRPQLTVMIRYRFSDFTLSPRRRLLLREGREVPLIPRYFDLLVLLVERRHEAVHRRDIFDRVWTDVIVSDSAMSQAVRTLRRTLGDDSREPRFIRTVARHGYRFVFADVIEEEDDDVWPEPVTLSQPQAVEADGEAYEPLLDRLTRAGATEGDRREAAELLHALGTSDALTRLGTRPGHAGARALLRDARWDAPGAERCRCSARPRRLQSRASCCGSGCAAPRELPPGDGQAPRRAVVWQASRPALRED